MAQQTKQSDSLTPSLPTISWAGQPVVTTKTLAHEYGTTENSIQANFNRNKGRFIEGKHFFKIAGAFLVSLRLTLSQSQIPAKARSLYLWTRRGAARHAKMLETDRAWDVFEALEESYFSKKVAPTDCISTVRDREPILIDSVLIMVRHRIPLPTVYRGLAHYVGVERFRSMTCGDVAKAHQFAERMLTGQTTGIDWRQLRDNRATLIGQQAQLDLGLLNLMLSPKGAAYAS